MSDGSEGPPLELRGLFEQFLSGDELGAMCAGMQSVTYRACHGMSRDAQKSARKG